MIKKINIIIICLVFFLISMSFVNGENGETSTIKYDKVMSNEIEGIVAIEGKKVQTKYEERTKRTIEESEIPFEIKISTQKNVYSLNDTIIVKVEFINNSNDMIKFIKPFKPYNNFFQERIGRVINEKTLIVEYPMDGMIAVTPGPNGWVYLSSGESYSIDFHINKNSKEYIGKDIFNYIGEYVISLDYIQKFLIIPDIGESRYTEQFIWQSNELEIEIK